MKQVLLIIAVVGCGGKTQSEIVEEAIRQNISKPKFAGELTGADFSMITALNLGSTQITDEGLKEVGKLPQLSWLYLYKTKVSDAGLKEVAKMKQLKVLGLVDNKITKAGVAQLKKALPKCIILSIPKK